jgi:hypothetical protein
MFESSPIAGMMTRIGFPEKFFELTVELIVPLTLELAYNGSTEKKRKKTAKMAKNLRIFIKKEPGWAFRFADMTKLYSKKNYCPVYFL